jgi:hypothetical protein
MRLSTVVSRVAVLACSTLLVSCASLHVEPAVQQGHVLSSLPESPDRDGRYAIYLHGIGLDRAPEEVARQRFTRVTQALAAQGMIVIAEIRGPDTIRKSPEDLDKYAQRVAGQVNALLSAGVPARRIIVIGYSRGGVIAQMTAGHVGRVDVGYAILAGCVSEHGSVKGFVPVQMRYAERLAGRFLSVVDDADKDFASCAPYFARAGSAIVVEETTLSTGKGHALFSEPDPAWLVPVANWMRGGLP